MPPHQVLLAIINTEQKKEKKEKKEVVMDGRAGAGAPVGRNSPEQT